MTILAQDFVKFVNCVCMCAGIVVQFESAWAAVGVRASQSAVRREPAGAVQKTAARLRPAAPLAAILPPRRPDLLQTEAQVAVQRPQQLHLVSGRWGRDSDGEYSVLSVYADTPLTVVHNSKLVFKEIALLLTTDIIGDLIISSAATIILCFVLFSTVNASLSQSSLWSSSVKKNCRDHALFLF